MNDLKTKSYLRKKVKDAKLAKNKIKGYKSQISQSCNKGKITEAEKELKYKRLNNASDVLKQYIEHYVTKLNTIKGSGIKTKRGGNVVFFNNPKELIK